MEYPVILREQTISVLLKLLFAHKDVGTAVNMFECMRTLGLTPNSIIYTVLLSGCTNAKAFDKAMLIYSQIMNTNVERTTNLQTAIIKMLCENKMVDKALSMISQDKPDAMLYNVLISACVRQNRLDEAGKLYTTLKRDKIPLSSQLSNTILNMHCARNNMEEALRFVDENRITKDSATYNVLVSACIRQEQYELAEELYHQALSENVDYVHLRTSILKLYCRTDRIENAIQLFEQMKQKYTLGSVTYNIMISGCIKAKEFEMAENLYTEFVQSNNAVSVELDNTILNMYCITNRYHEALHHFQNMQKLDDVSYVTMISGCTAMKHFDMADQLVSKAESNRIQSIDLTTATIRMYCASGRLENAKTLFSRMDKHSPTTYAILINGCLLADNIHLGLQMYTKLKQENIELTNELVNMIMKLLCATGSIQEALELLYSETVPVDNISYTILISACMKQRMYDQAFDLYSRLNTNDVE
jgi:pentatricopeptide repeat protein